MNVAARSALPPLITPAELAAQLGAPHLVIVDCRFDLADEDSGTRAYAEAHVPGAWYAHLGHDLSAPATADSGRHPLPDPHAFAALLARFGVTRLSRVVAYDQGGGALAARLWWMLRAAGLPQAQVLEGGFAAWRREGRPVSNVLPVAAAAAPLAIEGFDGWVTSDAVRRDLAAGRIHLVDARAADRFAGRNETIDPVAGHVPGAVNHPFATNLDADGNFLPRAVLAERWQSTLGTRRADETVIMCGSGITACHDLLALEAAGLSGARLYVGSWSEWIRDPSRPVAN